ncbi:DNA-formamidopyrimidine glycosylase [Laspinema olomoucense]|uniref:DNA-formamidopyrimidine glycosylase n=1 Tax=Laspinema olomoucense TaxID=3231600 RepID=UPI0021BB40D0|nr:DNA-formamidopyrimidine glycosylase [Laspinema sp. D3c]MCT7997418.1 DNA-formamidopyrimidine glycosylase [Laspinema sp. D3c]
MPELPEVETVCRGLNQLTLGTSILGGDVLLTRTIGHPVLPRDFLEGVQGCAIASWQRRGKYLLAQLSHPKDSDGVPRGSLGVHLRMTGQLLWVQREEPLQKHTRVRLFFEGDRELRFVDQRTFGQMWWVPPNVPIPSIITGLAKLGPEPFSPDFSVEYLTRQLHKRQKAIKTSLLDQTLVAGVGNIYADESLFLSGILPTKLCADLSRAEIERLHSQIIQVLQRAIAAGGTTFSNFLNVSGVNGNYGGVAWVYNRAGQPCRICGTALHRLKLTGRSSHFCPNCQS